MEVYTTWMACTNGSVFLSVKRVPIFIVRNIQTNVSEAEIGSMLQKLFKIKSWNAVPIYTEELQQNQSTSITGFVYYIFWYCLW